METWFAPMAKGLSLRRGLQQCKWRTVHVYSKGNRFCNTPEAFKPIPIPAANSMENASEWLNCLCFCLVRAKDESYLKEEQSKEAEEQQRILPDT